jgi:hypothetical protein
MRNASVAVRACAERRPHPPRPGDPPPADTRQRAEPPIAGPEGLKPMRALRHEDRGAFLQDTRHVFLDLTG